MARRSDRAPSRVDDRPAAPLTGQPGRPRYAMLAGVDPAVVIASPARRHRHRRRGGVGPPRTRPWTAPHRSSSGFRTRGPPDRGPLANATRSVAHCSMRSTRACSAWMPRNRVTEADRRAHTLLGHESGRAPGQDAHGGFHGPGGRGPGDPDPRPVDRRDDRRAATLRAPTDRRSSVRARPTPTDGGLWLVLEDVSELRRLQRIRAEFIDNLSHELRTPLTTVSLLAETLEREAEAAGDAIPAKMRERIAKIEVETGHLVQMVNELLDLSRIESGGTLAPGRRCRHGPSRRRFRRAPAPLRRTPGRDAPGRHAGGPAAGPRRLRPASGRSSSTSCTTRSSSARTAATSSSGDGVRGRGRDRRSRTTGSASRGRPRRASSSVSTRSTGPAFAARPAAGPASVWRSPATWSSSTAAGSGSSRARAQDRRSRSPCRSRMRRADWPDDRRGADGPPARRDAEHPQPRRPLARASAASARRHGSAPAGPARDPGGGLRHAAGPADRGGRGGALRGRPRLGRPARVRQQPAGPRAVRRARDVDRLDLGWNRAAHRRDRRAAGRRRSVPVVATHLHHVRSPTRRSATTRRRR